MVNEYVSWIRSIKRREQTLIKQCINTNILEALNRLTIISQNNYKYYKTVYIHIK